MSSAARFLAVITDGHSQHGSGWSRAGIRAAAATVFQEQRHGHAWLVTPPVQEWIVTYCQAHPHTPSHTLKVLLETELACTVSVTHLNRVRARLGVTYQRPRHEKKDPGSLRPCPSTRSLGRGACCCWLLRTRPR